MQHRIPSPLHLAASLALVPALAPGLAAQQLHFDGLLNTPVGSAGLGMDAAGNLVVDNLGSSGLDGVRVQLGDSQGGSMTPILDLEAGQHCIFESDVQLPGMSVPVTLSVQADPQGGWDLMRPDFSGLGHQTYGMRVYLDGQVIFEEEDLVGPARMQNGMTGLPQKVYMLPQPGSLVNVPHLVCVDHGGGVAPPGGQPLAGDFVEFFSPPSPILGIGALQFTAAGPNQFLIADEEARLFDLFLQGRDDAELRLVNGTVEIDNLGSSGCDGVSIAAPPGTTELSGEAQEFFAPDQPGAGVFLETKQSAGPIDRIAAEWQASQWMFQPDFAELGTNLYTLELYAGGQQVFSESGRSGLALASAGFSLFYKKSITYPDGTTESEWCIGRQNAAPHAIVGGPVVQADMFVMRSEGSTISNPEIASLDVMASDWNGHVTILKAKAQGGGSGDCLGQAYCNATVNSTGEVAQLCATGSTSVSANDLVLTCTQMPANQFGILFYGANQASIPLGNGVLCVGGTLYRLPIGSSDGSGALSQALDNTVPPQPSGQIAAGQQWFFQCWFRDPAAGGSSFNLSNGRALTFTN